MPIDLAWVHGELERLGWSRARVDPRGTIWEHPDRSHVVVVPPRIVAAGQARRILKLAEAVFTPEPEEDD